jgi:Tfp pilus assembly protein PilF
VVDVPVEIADIAPTIAELAGASMAGVDGRSLLPLLTGKSNGDPDRPAYAESYYQNILLGWSPLRSVRTTRWKFVEAPRPELYDLASDPAEVHNRIDERSALAAELKRALPAATPPASGDAASASTVEAAERLRSLGYVSGSTIARPDTSAVDPKDRVSVWAAIEDGIDRMTRDPAAAQQAFSRALQLDPANGLAMKYLADIDFRAARLRAARDRYRRAIDAGFRHSDVYVNVAAIAEREGRFDEARTALREAVHIAPGDADAWNRLGLLDARTGDLAGARKAFRSAVNAAPDRAEPYYNLGVIEQRSGNEAAAQSRFEDALARNPSYAEAHYELGTGYLAGKQFDRALEEYRAALASKPDYAEALFGAARAALELGRIDESRRRYQRFVQIAPREYAPQIAAAREALRRLK